MAANFARDLAATESLTLEEQLYYHLTSNFYPPIPSSMVQPCLEAIEAFYEDNLEQAIKLPAFVSYRGESYATAAAIIEGHRLEPWLDYED
jgi:hypothetical protein